MHLVEQMGRLYTQLQPGPLDKIELSCSGDIANYDLRPLQAALIKGLLESISDAHVNMINAQLLANNGVWRSLSRNRRLQPSSPILSHCASCMRTGILRRSPESLA